MTAKVSEKYVEKSSPKKTKKKIDKNKLLILLVVSSVLLVITGGSVGGILGAKKNKSLEKEEPLEKTVQNSTGKTVFKKVQKGKKKKPKKKRVLTEKQFDQILKVRSVLPKIRF